MTEHLFRKYPGSIKAIQLLLQKDATFQEICDDYEEICTWLQGYCCSQDRPSKECDHARELIRALENEIEKALRDDGF